MTPQVFAILSGLVAERFGLHFEATHTAVFEEKIGSRALEAGFSSLLDYYYFLRYDSEGEEEFHKLIDVLVVGETYLFRELEPLRCAIGDFIAPLVKTGKRPRVWSAACSTGEEPHTVAMMLAEREMLENVDLVASDISQAALARAQKGEFSRRSVRDELPPFASKWLSVDERRVKVAPALTAAIDWRRVNLMSDSTIAGLGTFDVILCRNVLIYFNDDVVKKVVKRLAAQLRPGGALFVGISESLLRFGTSLKCEERNGVFMYRKSNE